MKHKRFLNWVRRQPPGKGYTYMSATNCPYARYLKSRGVWPIVGGFGWSGLFLGLIPCCGRFGMDVGEALAATPRTYGALAERLGRFD